jgi:flagellin-like protein
MRLKGISPIVASVLLIAFSTVIAAVVGTWARDYTNIELTNLELCKEIKIFYSDFDYNSSTKEGIITIQNSGGPVSGYEIYALVSANQKELLKKIDQTIPESEGTTVSFKIVKLDNPKFLTIEVVDCPGVSLTVPLR